jgi:hypothetical protein
MIEKKTTMKKIGLFIFTVLSVSKAIAEEKRPTLILEVSIVNQMDSINLKALQSDTTICCAFEIISVRSNEHVSKVIHKESGILLGTFSGIPTSEMLKFVYQTNLKPEQISKIVPRILEWNSIQK